MNTEQLKMILDAIRSLGEGGKEALIWWVVLDKLPGFILGVAAFVTIFLVARMLIRALGPQPVATELTRAQTALEAMRTAWLYGPKDKNGNTDMEAYKLYKQVEEWAKTQGAKE